MLKILTRKMYDTDRSVFDLMYRLRYEVFIKGRGWSLPSKDGFEIDQYDGSDTIYFVDIDDEGNIIGSVRITPTDNASLLADYFAHLVSDAEPPRSSLVYEATRYIALPRQKSAEENRKVKARIVAAALVWCHDHGIEALQTVIDAELLPTFMEMSAHVRVMGDTFAYGGGKGVPGGGECLAISVPVTLDVIQDVMRFGGIAQHEVTSALAA